MKKAVAAALLLLNSCTPHGNSQLQSEGLKPALSNHDLAILIPFIEIPTLIDSVPTLTGADQPVGSPFLVPGALLALDDRVRADAKNQDMTAPGFVPHGAERPIFNVTPEDLYLAAIRFDPCSNILSVSPARETCLAEMRIVWQSLAKNTDTPEHPIEGLDRNIHTTYRLSYDEFALVVNQLRDLKQKSGIDYDQQELAGHPAIIHEGLDSPYLKGVLNLVTQFADGKHLVTVAAQANTSISGVWPMTGFNLVNGSIVQAPMPLFKDDKVFIQRLTGFDVTEIGGPDMTASIDEKIFFFPDELFHMTSEQQLETRTKVLNATHHFDNPLLQNAETADCASCHMARIIRENSVDRFPDLKVDAAGIYQNAQWNLNRSKSASGTHASLQQFSFLGDEYLIGQRVINESALDADLVKKLY